MSLDSLRTLHIGCGLDRRENAINLDMVDLPTVDVVHNLDVFPWPFPDDRFDDVIGFQVFEHVNDPIGFMKEVHRVLVPGGKLSLTVPHYQSNNSFTDPTHKRHCTLRTWDYWCVGTPLHNQFGPAYAGSAVFEKKVVEQVGEDIWIDLRKI